MKRFIIALMLIAPTFVSAQRASESKNAEEIANESTVYDEYIALPGSVITMRTYELPEFKSVNGKGIEKATYKAETAVVSFTANGQTKYYLKFERSGYNSPAITRYIPYEQVLELRNALDALVDNITKTPVGTAMLSEASYTVKDTHIEVGYKIRVEVKKGDRNEYISWHFTAEDRVDYCSVYFSDVNYFKDYLSNVIAEIKKLM